MKKSYSIAEVLRSREDISAKLTQKILKHFINEIKEAIQQELYDEPIDLFLFNIQFLPENTNFVCIEGKVSTFNLGDDTPDYSEDPHITEENYWKYGEYLNIIIPLELIEKPDVNEMTNYIKQLGNNNSLIPPNIIEKYSKNNNEDESPKFNIQDESAIVSDLNKDLDEIQVMALKLYDNTSIH